MKLTEGKRELWVDEVKLFACALVALGHMLAGLTPSGILRETDAFVWFVNSINLFHVPLFFICSGYLYQRRSRIDTPKKWIRNVGYKFLALGVPYLTFSLLSWLLKVVLSSAVNNAVEEPLWRILLNDPIQQYWYLYALALLFLITPTFKRVRGLVCVFAVAVAARIVYESETVTTSVRIVPYILKNEIWFTGGMLLAILRVPEKIRGRRLLPAGIALWGLFILTTLTEKSRQCSYSDFAEAFFACAATLLTVLSIREGDKLRSCVSRLSPYTFPVYLMHTFFAAATRILLIKLKVLSAPAHLAVGLVASFAGPVLLMKLMEKLKYPVFFVYPNRFLRREKKRQTTDTVI